VHRRCYAVVVTFDPSYGNGAAAALGALPGGRRLARM
jgi:hypothetical protein